MEARHTIGLIYFLDYDGMLIFTDGEEELTMPGNLLPDEMTEGVDQIRKHFAEKYLDAVFVDMTDAACFHA